MQLKIEQFDAHLKRGRLAACYVFCGDEALLSLEGQDALRAAAHAQGFSERTVLHASGRYDWSELDRAASGLSLFAQRQIVEIRLPGGKPGREGAAALCTHAARRHEDVLTIISLPALDGTAHRSEWVEALKEAGVWVVVEGIARERLPEWLAQRLARQGQRAHREALDFLADRVEGNLLAARQELEKLRLLHPEGELTLDQIRAAVFDVARFEGAGLPGAFVEGRRARILRTVEGLRAEGEPLPLLLWWMSEEIRGLLRIREALDEGRPFAAASRGIRLHAGPVLAERALARTDSARLGRLLARAARFDRLIKGLQPEDFDDDPWLELTEIALGLQVEERDAMERWES